MVDLDIPSGRFAAKHHRATIVYLQAARSPDGDVRAQERQYVCQCGWQSDLSASSPYLSSQYQDHVMQEWLRHKRKM